MASAGDAGELALQLVALELSLARRDEASIRGGYGAVLDPDFIEVGQGGRRWTRAETLATIAAEPPADDVAIERFDVASLATGVALATYDLIVTRAGGTLARSRRSSIWIRRDGRWRLRFHQGTPVPDDGPGPPRHP